MGNTTILMSIRATVNIIGNSKELGKRGGEKVCTELISVKNNYCTYSGDFEGE